MIFTHLKKRVKSEKVPCIPEPLTNQEWGFHYMYRNILLFLPGSIME